MIDGVTPLCGLPGLLGRVTMSAGVAICHVNVSRWGNPPSRGGFQVTKRSNEQMIIGIKLFAKILKKNKLRFFGNVLPHVAVVKS